MLPAGSTRSIESLPQPTGTPSYSGVVSGLGLGSGQGFTANCGTTNFGEYGCIPVTTTNATIVGTAAVGVSFELWGTVNPPNVTATYVIFGLASPSPSPSPSLPVNGVAWPAAFQPYAGSPIWSTAVHASPSYDANSTAIVDAWFPGAGNGYPVRNQEPGPYDYTHPVYFAASTDSAIKVVCSGGGCTTSGANAYATSMQIPAAARPAESTSFGAGDSHLAVVQPGGGESDVYCWNTTSTPTCDQPPGGVSSNWTSGSTMQLAGGADSCGNFFSGSGQLPSTSVGNTTAGAACEGAGLLSPQQLIAGQINHALFLIANCVSGTEYPVQTYTNIASCGGNAPKLGARLWYDVPDATTNASTALHPWEKAILDALHDYGGYVMDTYGGAIGMGVQFVPESEEPAYRFGQGDQWSGLAAQGWTSATISGAPAGYPRWTGANPWQPSGVNLNAHLHVLNVCITEQTC
jgi:hypothetical protein